MPLYKCAQMGSFFVSSSKKVVLPRRSMWESLPSGVCSPWSVRQEVLRASAPSRGAQRWTASRESRS